jgi:hypothetical protein
MSDGDGSELIKEINSFFKIGGCSHDKQNWHSNGPDEGPS